MQLLSFGHRGSRALPPRPPRIRLFLSRKGGAGNFEGWRDSFGSLSARRRGRHFSGCCQSARRPLLPTPGGRRGAGSSSLTCLSLSAAIRGCLSWSCFFRSPFCGNTEERAQAGRPGRQVRPEPRGPQPPARAASRAPQIPPAASRTRGGRAVPHGAAYLWLPPHLGSSRGGAGAVATRRRGPSRASLQAGVRVRVSVSVCRGRGEEQRAK